jgi:hypothetical protein
LSLSIRPSDVNTRNCATTLVGVFEFGIAFRTENIQIFIALFAGLKTRKPE